MIQIPTSFKGYFTIHGEGETDGIRKIKFSSTDQAGRKKYVLESVALYSLILNTFNQSKTRRIILHPDTISRKFSRKQQLQLLATSLLEIRDKLKDIESICIEPRGGDKHRKVLRAEIEDIEVLEDGLRDNKKRLGLCIDVAQLFIVHGNEGIINFLDNLRLHHLPVKEFHISDVLQNTKVKNRVAMEVGTGSINWKLILPLILEHCSELLIETLGGVKVFQRSKAFLESLLKEKNMT